MAGDYDLGTARGRIELDATSLYRSAAALKSLGIGMIGIGTVAVAGFAVAVGAAANFEQQMSAVQAVLGVSDEAMERVKNKALDLGASTVFGAQQVATAMEDLAKAGLNVDEIVGGAADATVQLTAAAGGAITLARSAEIAANAMRTFNLDARDMVHVADQIAGAANASTLEIDDIATSLRYVGPVAHTAGQSLDDVSTALAVLGDRGIKGSTAGTSLRGILLSLTPSSEKAANAMRDLGLITEDGGNKFFDAQGKMKSLAEVSQILQDATRGLSEQQKIEAFNTIFQRRAMASALIMADQGAAGFKRYSDEISKVSAADVAAKKLDNLKGDIQLLKSAMETALIRAGTPFQEFLRTLVQALTGVVRWFGKLNPEVQKWILIVSASLGTLFIFAGALSIVASRLFILYRLFRDIQAAIAILRGAWALLNATMLLNPIGLIILGILALIAAIILIWKNWDKIWNFIVKHKALALVLALIFPFIAALIAIVGAIKYVWENWDQIWSLIQQVFEAAVEGIVSAWGSVADFFVGVWNRIVAAFQAAWQAIQPVLSAIAEFFRDVGGVIGRFASAVGRQLTLFGRYFDKNIMPTLQAFGDLFAAIFQRAQSTFQVFWNIVRPIIEAVGEWVELYLLVQFRGTMAVVQGLVPVFQSAFSIIWTVISAFLGTLNAIWTPTWQAIQLVVAVALEAIQATFNIFVAAIKAVWTPFWRIVLAVVQRTWDFIKEFIDAAMLVIRGIIETITGLISGDWSKVWQGIRNTIAGVWDAIVSIVRFAMGLVWDVIRNGWDAIVRFFTGVPRAIQNALGDLTRTLWDRGYDLIHGLWDGLQSFWSTMVTFFTNLPRNILAFIGDLGRLLWDVGVSIIQGLIDGIKSMIRDGGPLGSVIKEIADKIPGPIKGFLGIGSPSKVMAQEVGIPVVQGISLGIKQALPGLKKTLQGTATMIESTRPLASVGVGLTGGGVTPFVPAGLTGVTTAPQQPAQVINEGDDVDINVVTNADPEEIVNSYFFGKRVRGL